MNLKHTTQLLRREAVPAGKAATKASAAALGWTFIILAVLLVAAVFAGVWYGKIGLNAAALTLVLVAIGLAVYGGYNITRDAQAGELFAAFLRDVLASVGGLLRSLRNQPPAPPADGDGA